MMLKAFESKELSEVAENKTITVREVLGNLKDVFRYSEEKPEYLDSKVIKRCYNDCQKALESLDALSKYLRDGELELFP